MARHFNPANVITWLQDEEFQQVLWELMDGEHIQNERTMQHHIASFVRMKLVEKVDGDFTYHQDFRVAIEEFDSERSDYPDFSIKGRGVQGQNSRTFLKVEFKFFGKKDEPEDDDKQKVRDDIEKIKSGLDPGEEGLKFEYGVVMFPVHSRDGWEPFIEEIIRETEDSEGLTILPIYRNQ